MSAAQLETITLGGGCFWCLEAVHLLVDGVTAVEPGYSNGHAVNPGYEHVCGGNTGPAEVVRITFDPQRITIHEPLANYSRAEDFHQRYFEQHPGQGHCAFVVAPKVEKFRRTFATRIRPAA